MRKKPATIFTLTATLSVALAVVLMLFSACNPISRDEVDWDKVKLELIALYDDYHNETTFQVKLWDTRKAGSIIDSSLAHDVVLDGRASEYWSNQEGFVWKKFGRVESGVVVYTDGKSRSFTNTLALPSAIRAQVDADRFAPKLTRGVAYDATWNPADPSLAAGETASFSITDDWGFILTTLSTETAGATKLTLSAELTARLSASDKDWCVFERSLIKTGSTVLTQTPPGGGKYTGLSASWAKIKLE